MRVLRILASLAAVVVFAAVVISVVWPYPNSRRRAYLGIVNTLRQIDGAKQMYAIDHNLRAGSVVGREDLRKYLREGSLNEHADYQFNPIGVPPEAVLPRAFDGLPAGTVIRLLTNDSRYVIVLPATHSSQGCQETK